MPPYTKSMEKSQDRHKYKLGLIGNCSYMALIDNRATIKWLCWPRFDSSFIFGSLIGGSENGEFSIEPQYDKVESVQSYIENTNILKTRVTTPDGSFEIIDFAPRFLMNDRYFKPLMLFRKISRLSGQPKVKVRCRPVDEYGKLQPRIAQGSNHIRYLDLSEDLRLTTNVSLSYLKDEREFLLTDDYYMVLSWGLPFEGSLKSTFDEFLSRTKEYWWLWVERCTLPRHYQKEVIRSALAIKLHQYEDTGGIVAACTTSLPEHPQSGRNWDYRFCWLRDTYYVLSTFNLLGHFDEMEGYSHFLENVALRNEQDLQPVYNIAGEGEIPEYELDLPGYLNNKPVRIGNQAAEQIQNDAYGQILLSLFHLYSDNRVIKSKNRLSMNLIKSIFYRLIKSIDQPDSGPWEFREKKSIHCYSILFHWAGCSAVQKLARIMKDSELEEAAIKGRSRAVELIERCYDPVRGVYTQTPGEPHLDASLLQMATLGYFYDKPLEFIKRHIEAIENDLSVKEGLLLRYKHQDDFGLQKTGFLVCSFWLVEAYFCIGENEKAQRILRELDKTKNHLGLMSEDVSFEDGSQWGNFPQTYSHVGLINCAFAMDRALNRPSFLIEED